MQSWKRLESRRILVFLLRLDKIFFALFFLLPCKTLFLLNEWLYVWFSEMKKALFVLTYSGNGKGSKEKVNVLLLCSYSS